MLGDSYVFVGNAGKAPEKTKNGGLMFSACRNFTFNGETVEKWVTFFINEKNVTATKTAGFITKGKKVMVEGVPTANAFMKGSEIITSLNVNVASILLLSPKEEEEIQDTADLEQETTTEKLS